MGGYDWVGGKLKSGEGEVGLFKAEFVTKIASPPGPSDTLKPHDIVVANVRYEAADSTELSLSVGEEIEVKYVLDHYGMLWGTSTTGKEGYFLSAQVDLKA